MSIFGMGLLNKNERSFGDRDIAADRDRFKAAIPSFRTCDMHGARVLPQVELFRAEGSPRGDAARTGRIFKCRLLRFQASSKRRCNVSVCVN
jgi:hypothetical protein